MEKNIRKTNKKSTKVIAKPKKVIAAKTKKQKAIKSKVVKAKTVKTKVVKVKKNVKVKVETKKVVMIKKKTPPRKGKMRYTPAELQHFKEILTAERKDILESAKANMKSLVDDESGDYVGENLTYSTHMAEQGTDEMEREKNYMFVQRDEKYLGYIQEALTRIDQGTYGICTDCLEVPKYLCDTCPLIPKERLELVPITQHCIECKNLRG
jgi:DnaK suppressor protein